MRGVGGLKPVYGLRTEGGWFWNPEVERTYFMNCRYSSLAQSYFLKRPDPRATESIIDAPNLILLLSTSGIDDRHSRSGVFLYYNIYFLVKICIHWSMKKDWIQDIVVCRLLYIWQARNHVKTWMNLTKQTVTGSPAQLHSPLLQFSWVSLKNHSPGHKSKVWGE